MSAKHQPNQRPTVPRIADMEKAPVARGWFLGDYQGLAADGHDLILFFSVATDAEDSADVMAIRADAP